MTLSARRRRRDRLDGIVAQLGWLWMLQGMVSLLVIWWLVS